MNSNNGFCFFGNFFFSIRSSLIHKVFLLISTKIGFAPEKITELYTAANVKFGTITSSPFFIPKVKRASCKADVPLDVDNAFLQPIDLQNILSKCLTYFPLDDIQPEFIASFTYFCSFPLMYGSYNGSSLNL